MLTIPQYLTISSFKCMYHVCWTFCLLPYWVFFMLFPFVCWFCFKINFSKNSFRNTIRVSNALDPDQAGYFVWPDLGPNCVQRLSTDYPSWRIDKKACKRNFPGAKRNRPAFTDIFQHVWLSQKHGKEKKTALIEFIHLNFASTSAPPPPSFASTLPPPSALYDHSFLM